MNKLKEDAFKLRLKGLSYTQINEQLGISKSTLSSWFSQLILSDELQSKINTRRVKGTTAFLERNRRQTAEAQERAKENRAKGRQMIGILSKREIMLVGGALYWAEGYKRGRFVKGRAIVAHEITLTNADPYLLRVFIRYAKDILGVPLEKIKIHIRMFAHQNEAELIKYWSTHLGVGGENFKTMRVKESISSLRKRPFDRLPYGVAQVRISNTQLFHELMGHIEGLKEIV